MEELPKSIIKAEVLIPKKLFVYYLKSCGQRPKGFRFASS